jgi:hypothetical protein
MTNTKRLILGYCDGCLNFGNPANGGLEDIYVEINDFYKNVLPLNGKTMSRADFFNLAGIVAVDTTVDYNNISCDEGLDPDCITMPKVSHKASILLIRRGK